MLSSASTAPGREVKRNIPSPWGRYELGPVRCVLLGLLEAPLALRIAVEEVQRELERLARVAWQIDEVEEGHALCVIEEHGLPVSVHLQPAGRGPAGDSCEGFGSGIIGHRPEVEADRGTDVRPPQAAVGEASSGRAHSLARRQIAVMRGHFELSRAHPELQQPRVDVHERRAPGAGEYPRID